MTISREVYMYEDGCVIMNRLRIHIVDCTIDIIL